MREGKRLSLVLLGKYVDDSGKLCLPGQAWRMGGGAGDWLHCSAEPLTLLPHRLCYSPPFVFDALGGSPAEVSFPFPTPTPYPSLLRGFISRS